MKHITVVVDFQIYLTLFEPIVKRLLARDVYVFVACPAAMVDSFEAELHSHSRLSFVDLDQIKRSYRIRFYLHRFLALLFTRIDFSHQYSKKHKQVNIRSDKTQRALLYLSKFVPSVPNRSINSFLHRLTGFCMKNPFPSQDVLVGSLNASAHLLCSKENRVFTVMESWDHSVKIPNGYCSRHVFVWNKELGEDWQNCQGERCWSAFYPLKLHPAIEFGRTQAAEKGETGINKVVYAVASTDRFSGPLTLSIERRLIEVLCEVTQKLEWTLLIKPRPNGREGEFQEFVESYNNVSCGVLGEHVGGAAANYGLSREYNDARFREVADARLVINAFTTFGLDAAVMGLPVAQIDLSECSEFKDSIEIFENHHIKKYLLGRSSVVRIQQARLAPAIEKLLTSDLSVAVNFSREIRDWLLPSRTRTASIDQMLDQIAQMGTSS